MYDRLTIPYVISLRDRPIGPIRDWKEDFENDKEGNQTYSDDRDDRPFDSRHHTPLSGIMPATDLLASPLSESSSLRGKRRCRQT
jgi:hypothetical protein